MAINPFATSRRGTEVLPGIYLLGTERVNFYVLEEGNSLTLVDCGFDGHRQRLDEWLSAKGRRWSDIEAVLLTHGHADHVGFAERLRRRGVPIYVHHADAEHAMNDWPHVPPQRLLQNLWRPSALQLFGEAAFDGLLVQPVLKSVHKIEGGGKLDIPGRPAVVVAEAPGHSHGCVAFSIPERNALFTGDTLMTRDPMLAIDGPLAFAARTSSNEAAFKALTFLEPFGEASLLPGHGDPIIGEGSVSQALRQARISS